MFTALAGMYMAAKVHFMQTKANMTKNQNQQVSETIYHNKIDKQDAKEKYKRGKLPESGYMTVEEYEQKSRGLTRKEINEKNLDKVDFPKDKNYVYVPQYNFKLVKYNEPVGSPELSLQRRLQFNRQINAQGIVSGDYTMLVYPSVYYYAEADCVSCDLFLIKLDTNKTNLERVQRANVLNKEPKPLLSTSKDIDNKFAFRTLTPIDFSVDNTKLLIKEKIGYKHDGIWETDLWIYDFNKNETKNLSAIREAISYYWKNTENVELNDIRWDIYPLGFDANNDNRVVLCAYAYTGDVPKFLGTWSIDVNNQASKLESLTGAGIPISVVGYKLEREQDVKSVSELEFEAKLEKNEVKRIEKAKRNEKKAISKQQLYEYRRQVYQMDMETLLKIRELKNSQKTKKVKQKDGVTDNLGIPPEESETTE